MSGLHAARGRVGFDRVRNLTDRALEQVDQNLDVARRRRDGGHARAADAAAAQDAGDPGSALSAGGSVTKPQMKWAVEVGAGNSDEPFVPGSG